MNDHYHAIVWIDHQEARIFRFDQIEAPPVVVHAQVSGHRMQHKANTKGSGHRGVDHEFFDAVTRVLSDVSAILLTGPGHARLELKNYLADRHPTVAKRISAVEALDHPTDTALLALARRFFRADDLMHRPNHP